MRNAGLRMINHRIDAEGDTLLHIEVSDVAD
jgi:hypothetical protein